MIMKMAQYRIKSDQKEQAEKVLETFVRLVRENEPDTLRYVAYRHADGESYTHVMYFKSEAAEEHHRTTEHQKRFAKQLKPLCEQEPVLTELDAVPANFI
jgi:quinol monooxygenase YgiN